MAVALCALFPRAAISQSETKITAIDGAADDYFGYSVSMSGDYMAVGAPNDDDKGSGSGAVYIYRKQYGTHVCPIAKLTASDGASGDVLGISVFIKDDLIIVGAPGDDDRGEWSGAAYIFAREGDIWREQTKLVASDGKADDSFGQSISFDDNYAVIGAAGYYSYYLVGSIYIFERNGTEWIERIKLQASDGLSGNQFGSSVCISGDYIIVGACGYDDNGDNSGSAYIFERVGNSWHEAAKLHASGGERGDRFGCAVGISGEYAVIGASEDQQNGPWTGAAYIFKRDGHKWLQKAKLGASADQENTRFGYSVSIDGRYCAIGAPFESAVYLFKQNDTTWTEEAKFKASDQPSLCTFGYRVANHMNGILVGAIYASHYGIHTGAAYIYQFESPNILAIQDVPHDQGGYVTLTWHASCLDNGQDTLSHYSIWRAIDEKLSKCTPASIEETSKDHPPPTVRSTLFNGQPYTWEWLADQPVHCYSHYTYTAPTLYDSTSLTNGMHYFLISANTHDPAVFYDSNVDSGYSVDNLPPLPPTGLLAFAGEYKVDLQWDASPEADLRYYVIYRNSSRHDSTSQINYTDTNVTPGCTYFYALAAVDVHENESGLSEVVFSTPVPVELESFAASVERQTVHLTWRTLSESNNYGFEIERCEADHHEKEWQKIGYLAGHGTSSESHDYFFEDILTPEQMARSSTLNYRLKQIDADGSFCHSEIIAVTLVLPKTFSLAQNYPNPFNARTTIQFAVPHRSLVKLAVYDLMGREVAVMVNEEVGAGVHSVTFDGGDVGSGLYCYCLKTREFMQTKKLLVLK
ncbi:T9SS type A sorting domain-containing protein [candidate division KSB1 bacterium]|nr:T9SS type A sorting domain-containing protein [candidate division KSB1 bacterium]